MYLHGQLIHPVPLKTNLQPINKCRIQSDIYKFKIQVQILLIRNLNNFWDQVIIKILKLKIKQMKEDFYRLMKTEMKVFVHKTRRHWNWMMYQIKSDPALLTKLKRSINRFLKSVNVWKRIVKFVKSKRKRKNWIMKGLLNFYKMIFLQIPET